MTDKHRVALGAIFTECNQFGGEPIDLSWFERYELRRGREVLAAEDGVAGGMLSVLAARGVEVAPLLFASTCPGGPLTRACYDPLKEELLTRLNEALPVDGVLMPLHGAAAVEGGVDLEGDLLAAVRDVVGDAVPIVATLDLHAHISAQMMRAADGLVAWETYPHRDAFSTGERGARLLCDTLAGACKPAMAMAKVPVLTGAIHGSTEDDDPFAQVMALAKAGEQRDGILSTSAILVHPYLDFAGMGSGGLVIADGDFAKAEALARELATAYWERRFALEPELYAPEDAVRAGLAVRVARWYWWRLRTAAAGERLAIAWRRWRRCCRSSWTDRRWCPWSMPARLRLATKLALGPRWSWRWGTGTIRVGDSRLTCAVGCCG